MFALIAKMLFCLLLAAAIGFVVGWLIRGLRGNASSPGEHDELRHELDASRARASALEAEVNDLRPLAGQVSALESSLASARTGWDGEKTAALAAAATAAAALAAAQGALADQEKAYADLDARYKVGEGLPSDAAAMRQRTVQLEADLAAALAAGAAASQLQADLSASQRAFADLQARARVNEGYEGAVRVLRSRVEELEAEIERLRRHAGQTEVKLTQCGDARQAAEAQVAALASERESTLARLGALEKAEKLRLSRPPRQFFTKPHLVDDLEWIYGVGPKLAEMLNNLGIYQFKQVAMWNDEDVEFFDRQLAQFHGRIRRENWIQSAQEEQYKKYGEWLGDGEPTASMPETGNRPA